MSIIRVEHNKQNPFVMNRKFLGIWIPREIWLNKSLNGDEKALWAEIQSLHDDEKGGCFASNEYLMEFMNCQERALQNMLSKLKKMNLLEQVSFNGRQRILKAIAPNDKSFLSTSEVQKNAPLDSEGCRKMHLSDAEKCTSRGTPSDIYYSKEDNKEYIARSDEKTPHPNENNSPQTKTPSSLRAKADFFFSQEKGEFEGITEEDKNSWRQLYSNTDVQKEILLMIQWIKANPSKSNKKLWRKFVISWLGKAEDRAVNRKAYSSTQKVDRRTKNLDGSAAEVNYGW